MAGIISPWLLCQGMVGLVNVKTDYRVRATIVRFSSRDLRGHAQATDQRGSEVPPVGRHSQVPRQRGRRRGTTRESALLGGLLFCRGRGRARRLLLASAGFSGSFFRCCHDFAPLPIFLVPIV